MYNRKHYIEQCVNSALNQTFQEEYEIIIRDNCSTDGGYEFVAEKYAQQIFEGKIKLYRNKENLGETKNTIKLFHDANGKYIYVLHSDDMYLPHALQHLYEVAEKTNADVVHESFLLISPKSGIINDISECKPTCREINTFDKINIMSDNPFDRFQEWIKGGTFIDMQYNLFEKDFVLENEVFFEKGCHLYAALWWIMSAKIFVKTPIICYICRNAPDSETNSKISTQKIIECILGDFEMLDHMDKLFQKIEFFKNNEYFQYMAKAHMLYISNNWNIDRHNIYANGITLELYSAIADAFKKYFGHDYFYPMFCFNLNRVMPFNRRGDIINFENNTPPQSQHK